MGEGMDRPGRNRRHDRRACAIARKVAAGLLYCDGMTTVLGDGWCNEITLVRLHVIVRDKLILNEIETCNQKK
jgi:hypothetical protein